MELIPARLLSGADLAAAEAIYLAAFPVALRAPFADLLADDLLVLIVNGRPAGFTVTRRLGTTGWVFLRYFAVHDRGGGIGSRMWQLLIDYWSAAGHDRILLDVEDPDEPGIDEAEQSIRWRRIAFYQRLGARLLPVTGYCPPQPGGHPHPLRLITSPGTTDAPVRDLVLAVYRYRYDLEPGHPAVRRTRVSADRPRTG